MRKLPNVDPSSRGNILKCLLLLVGVAVSSVAPGQDRVEADVSKILKEKTQTFSDAGQRGDGRKMGAVLDDGVTFFNENGDRSTKAEMSQGASPPPAGVKTRMTIEDWACRTYGDVAVTSFIDDQQQDFHGQPVHARFRSVETWRKIGDDWRMIASQTVALYDDPKPTTLSVDQLDQYVGTYRAAPDTTFVFRRVGDTLLASVNGGPTSAQAAEIADVFFTPGRPRYRKLFQRDASGRVTSFLYRHEGHDVVFTKE
jgi:hypothetical protein